MSRYCSNSCTNWCCCTGDRWPGINLPRVEGAVSAAVSAGPMISAALIMPTRCPAFKVIGSDLWLCNATHIAGPLATIGEDDTHRGSSRLGSKQTVWFGQGFATCTKQMDLARTYTPSIKTAWATSAIVVVWDAISMETWAVAAVEDESSCACKVCRGLGYGCALCNVYLDPQLDHQVHANKGGSASQSWNDNKGHPACGWPRFQL